MEEDARSEVVNAAAGLGPLILEQRAATEADRRLAKPIVEALVETRLCRFGLDATEQGLDADVTDWLGALETLAGFEASVPWIVWNNALVGLFARHLEPDARAELFADPGWLYAQSTRPTGRATPDARGYRVSGRWSLVSGCELAEWLVLLAEIVDGELAEGAEPETRFLFVSRDDVEILDTWHVGGLRGSGSHDVVVDDVHVSRLHSFSPADGVKGTGAGARRRMHVIATLGAGFAAMTLGIAATSVATILAKGRPEPAGGPAPGLRERPPVLSEVATARAALEAARFQLHRCAAHLWQLAESGATIPLAALADLYAAADHANAVARPIVDRMHGFGGTSALYVASPLERAHRDLHAMLRHVVAQPIWAEDAGRVAFGLEPVAPLFAV